MRETHYNGVLSETRFMLECLRRKWDVARPVAEIYPYDFVIRLEDNWRTVQVKTAFHPAGRQVKLDSLRANIRQRVGGKSIPYKAGMFDLLAIVYEETIWLMPFACIHNYSSSISMRGYERFILRDGYTPDLGSPEEHLAYVRALKRVNPRRKATQEQVHAIRQEYINGATRESLEAKYQLAKSSVARILRGEGYANWPPDAETLAQLRVTSQINMDRVTVGRRRDKDGNETIMP